MTEPIVVQPAQKRRREVFWLQATPWFPDGAPQREEYLSDGEHESACRVYALEWLQIYECPGCINPDCPAHGLDASLDRRFRERLQKAINTPAAQERRED